MKSFHFYSVVALIVCAGSFASISVARSDDAPRGWSQSMGFSSPSQQAVGFNSALVERQLRGGYKGPGTVVNSTSHTTNYTYCEKAGSCQNGGTATNVNGYSSITVDNSEGATLDVTIDAESDQDSVTIPVAADDFDDIRIE